MSLVSTEPAKLGKKRDWSPLAAFALQLRIISALMMRDGSARFGHENLGFFWVMGEPLLLTIGVMGMWTMTGMTHGHGDVGLVPFALSGYSCITLWRHVAGQAPHRIRQNVQLLFHRNIRVLDILVARALLETIAILTAFFIAYIPLALFGVIQPIHDPLVLFGGWAFQAWFSFGVSMIFAGLSEIYDTVERFVPPIMYITLPMTGSFYMLYWLPMGVRKIALYSPLVNSQEMFRGGLFPPDIPTYWSVGYLLVWCIGLTAVGLPIVNAAQKHATME